MLSVLAGSEVVLKLAIPPEREAVPRTVDPSRNCTEPVGVPEAVVDTVAAKLTLLPRLALLAEALSAVAVVAFATSTVTAFEVPEAKPLWLLE
jgi:hypothetical protein